MQFLRVSALLAMLVCLAMPASSSTGWIDFGANQPDATPQTTLVSSSAMSASIAVEVPGLHAEEITNARGTFTRLTIPGNAHAIEIGRPMVPVIREFIEIPQGAAPTLRIMRAQYAEATLAELGITGRLYPVQAPIDKVPGAREAAGFAIDEAAYAMNVFAPDVPAALGEIGQKRAHRFVELEIFPVQYNPAAGTVRYLTSIELEVDYSGGDWARTSSMLERYASHDFDSFARQHFINGESFDQRGLLEVPVGYLIICYDAFEQAIQPLADLRHKLGHQTTLTTLSEIPGGPTTSGIQAYIQDAYDTWPVPPTFVVLIGDTPQIPTFTGVASSSASDLYYVCMDGPADWLPDMFVGRFSCTSPTEVSHLVDKTVRYITFDLASNPTDWVEEATFMASTDNHTVSEGTHNYVIDTWVEPAGYLVNKRYSYYGATTQECLNDINGGLSMLTYSGHGSTNGWADGPPVSAAQVNALQNADMWPLVQSYACITGDFASHCFGETWTRAPHGTNLFLGASANSQWTEDDIMERRVYDAWFGEDYIWVRGMFDEGLWAVYEAYSGGGLSRNYYEKYTVFGDPALTPWTAMPVALDVTYDDAFPVGGSQFAVDVSAAGGGAVVNALVCIYMDGEFYETAYTDETGHVDITIATPPNSVGTMEVGVFAHNYLVHMGSVEVIVPVTYLINPRSVLINTTSPVTITVWDDMGAPKPDIEITIDGWGITPQVDVTDTNGQAHFSVTPPYGEHLDVIGSEIGESYNCIESVLPVYGGSNFVTADIDASVPAIGLFGALAPHYEGTISGSASQTGFMLYALGCGVDAEIGSGGSGNVDLLVTPDETGEMQAAIAKNGFNVYLENVTVQMVYGQLAGEIYETGGAATIAGASIRGYEAGADTSSTPPVFTATSNASGAYAIVGDLEVDYYDVYVSKFGYLAGYGEVFVQVGANDADFYLDFAPSGVVSGTVTEVGTGLPLAATIKVYRGDTGEEYAQVVSDTLAGGYYQVSLPYFDYTMNVRAWHHIPVNQGITVSDPTMTINFQLEETLANILILDDDDAKYETVKLDKSGAVLATDVGDVASPDKAKSSTEFANDLVAIGYDVTQETSTSSDPATWLNYDFIISASGDDTSPIENSTYRTAVESYVGAGGKLLIEGGEVGYDAVSSPGYPTFAATVLHIVDWEHDQSGDITVHDSNHPITTTPNTLGTISCSYAGYGDQDSSIPDAAGQIICAWSSYGTLPSVQIYDDNPDPASCQIIYYSFNYAAAEATGRKDLLENSINYLIAQESTPTGGIAGTVTLQGETNHSGVTVTAYPGGASGITAADGTYAIPAMYAGTYTVEATKAGWSIGQAEGVVVTEGQQTTGVDFLLTPTQEYEYCETPSLSIPDNNPAGVYDTCPFGESLTVSDVEIYVNLTHTYIGDLIVEISSPEGTTVRLHNRTGGSASNIIGWYDSQLQVDGPGTLDDFLAENAQGDWEIWVSDNAGIDTGTLNEWCVKVIGGATTGIEGGAASSAVPVRYVLGGVTPNPFNPTTTIAYGLPHDGPVELAIYNVSGQRVRTLVDAVEIAGYFEVAWDGRDDQGASMASGIYFCRMTAAGFDRSAKMVLLK